MQIVPFEKKYKDQVIKLLEKAFPEEVSGDTGLESFHTCFSVAGGDLLPKTLKLLNTDRVLKYFVAVDENNKVQGVTGVYSVEKGYLKKMGITADKETIDRLEDKKNFYIGWTAVSEEMQGKGLGKSLIKTILGKAKEVLRTEGLSDGNLMVLADQKNDLFYTQKCGMECQLEDPYVNIYAAPISKIEQTISPFSYKQAEQKAVLNYKQR